MNLKYSIYLIVLLILSGCSSNDKNGSDEHAHEHTSDTQQIVRLHLDHGHKWKVNDEMKPFITASEELLSIYSDTENNDYTKLAMDLKSQNTMLISSCTMTGESHDQLHIWLKKHLELVSELSKAENEHSAYALIDKLEESFITYHMYFE